jgi:hypothetical protein
MAVSLLFFYDIISMTKIQQARVDAHINSLDLWQDLPWILEQHATNEEVENIRWRVQKLFEE